MINPFLVMKETENYFNLSAGTMIEFTRGESHTPRCIAMYIVYTLCTHSYNKTARYFDRKEHTATMRNCKEIENNRVKLGNEDINNAIITLTNKFLTNQGS